MARGRAVLIATGGGLLAALFYLSILTGSTGSLILAYLTPLPLFVIGLSLGVPGAAVAGTAACAAVLAVGGLVAAAAFLAVYALPVALAVRQALLSRNAADGSVQWYPPGPVLLWLIGYALAAFCVAAAVAVSSGTDLSAVTRAVVDAQFGQLPAELRPAPETSALPSLLAWLLPGLFVASWLVMLAANAALAQGALMRFGRNLRPAMAMADVAFANAALFAFAAALLAAVAAPGLIGMAGVTAALALGTGYAFVGLGVVHYTLRRRPAKPLLLTLFYVLMALLLWPVLLVAGLGLVEQTYGLRRRLAAGAKGKD